MDGILRSDKGFSLVEAMVAFAVLAIGMAGVATMLIMSMQSDQQSAELRDGEHIAMRIIEELKADASRSDMDISHLERTGSLLGYPYIWSLTSNFPSLGLDQLDITVGWGGENCRGDAIDNCRYKTRIINFLVPYAPHI
jgi:prepilin-type N-terminal cleavage/methylation domain-containing protein